MVSIGNQDYLFTPSQVDCNQLTVSGFLLMVLVVVGLDVNILIFIFPMSGSHSNHCHRDIPLRLTSTCLWYKGYGKYCMVYKPDSVYVLIF